MMRTMKTRAMMTRTTKRTMLRRLMEDAFEIVSLMAFMAFVAVLAHGLPG